MQFAASFVTAVLFYFLLRKRWVPIVWTAIIVLFIWSQPALQIFHGYSSLLPYILGIIASYLALYFIFWSPSLSLVRRFIVATLLLMIGWLTFQATPFAGLSLVSFYALTSKNDDARSENKKLILFIVALATSAVIYMVAYGIILRLFQANTYELTARAFSFISGDLSSDDYLQLFDARNYLGIFEWWNYLLPIVRFTPTQFYLATGISALFWSLIFIWSFLLELARQPRRFILAKYLLATIAILLTLAPIVADNFSGRQHLFFPAVSTLTLAFGYALFIISRRYLLWERHRAWIISLCFPILLFVILGARTNLDRGLVLPANRFYNFVRSEIIEHTDEPYDHVLVITTPQPHYCKFEPCRAFFGRRLATAWRDGYDGVIFYTQMLARLGMPHDIPIQFTSSPEALPDVGDPLIIDNQKLLEYFQRDEGY
jgi:hypothetical protein